MKLDAAFSTTAGRWCVVSTACALALAPMANDVARAQDNTVPAQNALAGSRVFGDKGCNRCHAIRGLGGTEAPDLAATPRLRTFYDLAAAMWNHLPAMVEGMDQLGLEHPTLSEQESANLIAFLHSLNFFDPVGDHDHGKELFATKHCVACHQAGGVGGVVGPNLGTLSRSVAPIQVAAAMWNHGPRMSAMMAERDITRPRFSAAELNDLIAFLELEKDVVSSEPVHVLPGLAGNGARLFSDKGCVECHSVHGAGGHQAPDLAQRGVSSSMLAFAAAMWNKAPAMTALMRARGLTPPQLEPREMADIVAYLYSVRYFAEPGNTRQGRNLLRTKGCTTCHSLNGTGGTGGPDLSSVRHLESPAAVIAALWNHGAVKGIVRPDVPWSTLGASDIANLAAPLRPHAPLAQGWMITTRTRFTYSMSILSRQIP
jgi:mono/diheme cytochrome c family protein